MGRDGGVDATMKMLNSPDIDRVKLHGAIVTAEEIAQKALTSCVEMVVDAETLQHLSIVLSDGSRDPSAVRKLLWAVSHASSTTTVD